MKYTFLLPALFLLILFSCKKEDPVVEEPAKFGKIDFQFSHKVNGQLLIIDTMVYTNAAGNEYLINEIQYFVSDITLHKADGSTKMITTANGIHYIDTDIPSTHTWSVSDDIPIGNYASVSFTFGINEAKNQTGLFVNSPEKDMFWPDFLGGGYHYMKMNGFWKDINAHLAPYNFHLGIGQIYDTVVTDSIIGFVQNYFTVTLPNSAFAVSENYTTHAGIIMNIESWLNTPNIFNFNYWGGSIMQNQAAMHTIVENGTDVFTFQINP
jgi:hypothetical protein